MRHVAIKIKFDNSLKVLVLVRIGNISGARTP